MIQAPLPNGLRYDVRLVPRAARGERISRALQSAVAADLLADLRLKTGVGEGPSSKSHSRDLVAVALAEVGRVGIDIEYRATGRPIEKIAHHLMDAAPSDALAAYRAFTFWEAYFKAFGHFPGKALLRAVAGGVGPAQVLDGLRLLHDTVEGDFSLTLVWAQL
jgi:hypothetical protein